MLARFACSGSQSHPPQKNPRSANVDIHCDIISCKLAWQSSISRVQHSRAWKHGQFKFDIQSRTVLPRNAMTAWYLLSPCFRHKPVLCWNDCMNRAGFWHGGFLPPIPHCCKEIWVSPKIRLLPSGTLSHISLDLGNSKSIALSAKLVVIVDGRACWWHLCNNSCDCLLQVVQL